MNSKTSPKLTGIVYSQRLSHLGHLQRENVSHGTQVWEANSKTSPVNQLYRDREKYENITHYGLEDKCGDDFLKVFNGITSVRWAILNYGLLNRAVYCGLIVWVCASVRRPSVRVCLCVCVCVYVRRWLGMCWHVCSNVSLYTRVR